jgi:hypothetical protein
LLLLENDKAAGSAPAQLRVVPATSGGKLLTADWEKTDATSPLGKPKNSAHAPCGAHMVEFNSKSKEIFVRCSSQAAF